MLRPLAEDVLFQPAEAPMQEEQLVELEELAATIREHQEIPWGFSKLLALALSWVGVYVVDAALVLPLLQLPGQWWLLLVAPGCYALVFFHSFQWKRWIRQNLQGRTLLIRGHGNDPARPFACTLIPAHTLVETWKGALPIVSLSLGGLGNTSRFYTQELCSHPWRIETFQVTDNTADPLRLYVRDQNGNGLWFPLSQLFLALETHERGQCATFEDLVFLEYDVPKKTSDTDHETYTIN